MAFQFLYNGYQLVSSTGSSTTSVSNNYDGNDLVTTVDTISSSPVEIDGGTLKATDPTGNGTNNVIQNTINLNLYNRILAILSGLTENGAVYATSSSAITSTTAMDFGQFLMGRATNATPILATLVGTANQITANAEPGNNIYKFSLPQNIDYNADVLFNNIQVVQGNVTSPPTSATNIVNKTYADTNYLSSANTGVTAASYGSATQVATFTVTSKGQLSVAANVSIAITASQITGLTDGQLVIGSTGNPGVATSLTGTANQIIVTLGAGSITLSLPQSIATGSSPTFNGLTLTTGQVSTTPSGATDIVNKAYVDMVAQGFDQKASVKVMSISNITLSGLQTIDGYLTLVNDRVLVNGETSNVNNGIYIASSGAWSRSADFAAGTDQIGAYTFVENGTLYAKTGWTNIGSGVVGTGPTIFTQSVGPGTYTASTGLTLTGTAFSITNTAVSAASYGSASLVATFTVNAQGQLTTAASIAIAIAASQVTSGILTATVGGTANGFTAFNGPATSTKTFTLPNASATILTSNTPVTIAQGGTNSIAALSNNLMMGSISGLIVELTGFSVGAQGTASLTMSGTTGLFELYSSTSNPQMNIGNSSGNSTTGSNFGKINFWGYFSSLVSTAYIQCVASQNFGAGARGTNLEVYTVANNSTTANLNTRFLNDGTLVSNSGVRFGSNSANVLSQYISDVAFSVTLTNWTNTGTVTATGFYVKIGSLVKATYYISSTGNISATYNTSTINLPVAALHYDAGSMINTATTQPTMTTCYTNTGSTLYPGTTGIITTGGTLIITIEYSAT